MKIGILGAGRIGGNLAIQWADQGHELMLGVRDVNNEKVLSLINSIGTNVQAGSIQAAVDFAEVVVLAVPWSAVADVLGQVSNWQGKILVDATNRVVPAPHDSAPTAAGDVARLAPGARLVKAFNCVGAEHILKPYLEDRDISMFICGDDTEAKGVVSKLSAQIGFDPIDCGLMSNVHLLESMALLWIYLSRQVGREIAFKLLKG